MGWGKCNFNDNEHITKHAIFENYYLFSTKSISIKTWQELLK